MISLAKNIQHLFVTDDGSLPDIYVENLNREKFEKIVEHCLTSWSNENTILAWDNELNKEVKLRQSEFFKKFFNAQLSVRPIHLDKANINGTTLPQLNMFIYGPAPAEIENIIFDYRMGKDWTEKTILCILEFFALILDIAPNAKVFRAPEGYHDSPNIEFTDTLNKYYDDTRKEKLNAPL